MLRGGAKTGTIKEYLEKKIGEGMGNMNTWTEMEGDAISCGVVWRG